MKQSNKGEGKEDLVSKTRLKEMGFTDSMIRDLLPVPIEKANPMYRSAAPMKLWPRRIVDEAMGAAEFMERKALADKRRASAAKGVAKRRESTREHFDRLISEIEVEKLPVAEVMKRSLEDRRLLNESRGVYGKAPERTLERWAVNYIRHNLTDYDEGLYSAKGEVGTHEEYERYKCAVLDAIADAYPALRGECRRQMAPARERQVMERAFRS